MQRLEKELPLAAIEHIARLIEARNLRSVAAGVSQRSFWKRMAELQRERARAAQTTPEKALALYASDSGVDLNPDEFGADIFVSYEGMREGELTVAPPWHRFSVEQYLAGGTLNAGMWRALPEDVCQIYVSTVDFGELLGLERENIEGWWFYSHADCSARDGLSTSEQDLLQQYAEYRCSEAESCERVKVFRQGLLATTSSSD
jgi:hypothetical protein